MRSTMTVTIIPTTTTTTIVAIAHVTSTTTNKTITATSEVLEIQFIRDRMRTSRWTRSKPSDINKTVQIELVCLDRGYEVAAPEPGLGLKGYYVNQ